MLWSTSNAANAASWSFAMFAEGASYPAAARQSPPVLVQVARQLGFPAPTFAVAQRLDAGAWEEEAISLVVQPGQAGAYFPERREPGSGAPGGPVGAKTATAAPQVPERAVGGLQHSRRYEVRLSAFWAVQQATVPFVTITAYTALRAPVGSIAVTGSPEVTLTLAPPDGRTGMDLLVRNGTGDFDALYAAVGPTEASYVSSVDTCGRPALYLAYLRNTQWPAMRQTSAPLVLQVDTPCV